MCQAAHLKSHSHPQEYQNTAERFQSRDLNDNSDIEWSLLLNVAVFGMKPLL